MGDQNSNVKYRKLKSEEIDVMLSRGCVCEDWSMVSVVDDFIPDRFKNVSFYGDIKLGIMEKRIDSVV